MEKRIRELVIEAIETELYVNKANTTLTIEDKRTGQTLEVVFDLIVSIKSVTLDNETQTF